MKLLKEHRRRWLMLRAANEIRRKSGASSAWPNRFRVPRTRQLSRVQIWQGGDPEWAICMKPPSTPPKALCFDSNLEDSVRFIDWIRSAGLYRYQTGISFVMRPSGKQPQIVGYADFAKLDYISTAAAVVLAAEYERLAKVANEVPPTVNLDRWNDNVFRKLFQLGFFEIVGFAPKRDDVVIQSGSTRTMQIVSMKNADDLARVDEALQDLGKFLNPSESLPDEIIIEILTALSEAISNVTSHAYPIDIPTEFPHLSSLWVSATADKSNNSITIVVYDQGATIPVTYPRISRVERVGNFMRRAVKLEPAFDFENDGTYVRAAMRYGGSRTDQRHRGKGLPQMMEVITRAGAGTMTVLSRGGWARRGIDGRLRSGAVSSSIGGTLIEWSVELSQSRTVVGQ